jgi:membrane-bound lytic murein transglycosylase MltF
MNSIRFISVPVVYVVAALFILLALCPVTRAAEKQKDLMDEWVREKFMGDYPEMVKRRMIRVLIPPSKTFFFIDRGKKQGMTYEAAMAFEKFVNKKIKAKHLKVKVVVIPTTREHLLSDLRDGYGDIAAGNLTITEERLRLVDFADPFLTGVDEIIAASASVAPLASLFDLSGKEVYVRKSSSYYSSLVNLNKNLVQLHKKPVRIRLVDEYLEDEDLLEMVNADLLPMIVIDSTKGRFWEQIFTNVRLYPDIKVRTGGRIAWAVRKNCPTLKKVINEFVKKNKKGTLTGNILYNRYLKNSRYIKNNLRAAERKKYEQTVALFKKYAHKYDFPYLLLTALAYQESGLNHKKKSAAGAIGIMQVLPRTAKDKNIGISNIERIENNIHAGSKYLRFMKDRYFSKGDLDELNSDLFTIAAYNAGPARIAKLRREAAQRGLDPNVWFNNVEVIAARRIGRETVQYVGNIYKYYVAYKRILEQEQEKEKQRKQLKEQKKHT